MPPAHADPRLPSPQDSRLAASARQAIASGRDLALNELPSVVKERIVEMLEATEAGNAISVVEVKAEITTQQAADLLNVSRPFLVKLVESGALPARLVGTHRRLRLRDVLAYKEQSDHKREAVLDELVADAQAQEMGYGRV